MPLLDQQIVGRNTGDRVIVLSSDPKGSEYIEWQATNDPSGNDVQIVPPAIANGAAFAKLIQRGLIELLDAPEHFAEAIQKQNDAFAARSQAGADAAKASLDPDAKNDMLSIPCVGPDARGNTGKCGNDVPVREATKDDKPPLCSQHIAMAPEYVPSDEQVGTEIKKVWTRVTMGARETQTHTG